MGEPLQQKCRKVRKKENKHRFNLNIKFSLKNSRGICRVCLKTSLMMVNIFNCSSKLGIPIADMIIEAIGCKVSPGDCFPQTICPPCLQEVQGFYLLELELRLITIFQSESLRCQEVNTQNIEDDLQNKCVKVEIDDFGDQVKSEPSSSESESESDFSGSDMKLASKLLQAFGDMIKNELTIKPDLRPKTF